jgi:hypothetical protein
VVSRNQYDGYRMRVERDRDRIRLISRGGYDWTSRFPWIGEAALRNRIRQFVIDGEAVILGFDGISDLSRASVSFRRCQLIVWCRHPLISYSATAPRPSPRSSEPHRASVPPPPPPS